MSNQAALKELNTAVREEVGAGVVNATRQGAAARKPEDMARQQGRGAANQIAALLNFFIGMCAVDDHRVNLFPFDEAAVRAEVERNNAAQRPS